MLFGLQTIGHCMFDRSTRDINKHLEYINSERGAREPEKLRIVYGLNPMCTVPFKLHISSQSSNSLKWNLAIAFGRLLSTAINHSEYDDEKKTIS